jgi:hypothetical protein
MTEKDVTDEVRGILADPTPAPEGEAVVVPDAPSIALLLDYLDGKAVVVPAAEAPSMKKVAAVIRGLVALVEEQRAGEKQISDQMDRLQDLVGQPLYASPVVPVSREEIARKIWVAFTGNQDIWPRVTVANETAADCYKAADAIIAALGTKGADHD